MPRKPKRPCRHPMCPELTSEGYCTTHKKKNQRVQDKERGTAHERGYTYKWNKYSRWFLKQPDNVFCKLQLQGCNNIARCVDHIKPAPPHSDLFWDSDNHQASCIRCNSAKGKKEMIGQGKPFESYYR